MMRKKKTSKAKKVWIFKWLLKKNGCREIHLKKDFFKTKKNKKVEFFKVILDMNDYKSFTLMVDVRPDPKISRTVLESLEIPFKFNVSYADVLDGILKAMKKNDSDCWMSDNWSNRHVGPFLKKDITMEELEIEFDLSWRDAFIKA